MADVRTRKPKIKRSLLNYVIFVHQIPTEPISGRRERSITQWVADSLRVLSINPTILTAEEILARINKAENIDSVSSKTTSSLGKDPSNNKSLAKSTSEYQSQDYLKLKKLKRVVKERNYERGGIPAWNNNYSLLKTRQSKKDTSISKYFESDMHLILNQLKNKVEELNRKVSIRSQDPEQRQNPINDLNLNNKHWVIILESWIRYHPDMPELNVLAKNHNFATFWFSNVISKKNVEKKIMRLARNIIVNRNNFKQSFKNKKKNKQLHNSSEFLGLATTSHVNKSNNDEKSNAADDELEWKLHNIAILDSYFDDIIPVDKDKKEKKIKTLYHHRNHARSYSDANSILNSSVGDLSNMSYYWKTSSSSLSAIGDTNSDNKDKDNKKQVADPDEFTLPLVNKGTFTKIVHGPDNGNSTNNNNTGSEVIDGFSHNYLSPVTKLRRSKYVNPSLRAKNESPNKPSLSSSINFSQNEKSRLPTRLPGQTKHQKPLKTKQQPNLLQHHDKGDRKKGRKVQLNIKVGNHKLETPTSSNKNILSHKTRNVPKEREKMKNLSTSSISINNNNHNRNDLDVKGIKDDYDTDDSSAGDINNKNSPDNLIKIVRWKDRRTLPTTRDIRYRKHVRDGYLVNSSEDESKTEESELFMGWVGCPKRRSTDVSIFSRIYNSTRRFLRFVGHSINIYCFLPWTNIFSRNLNSSNASKIHPQHSNSNSSSLRSVLPTQPKNNSSTIIIEEEVLCSTDDEESKI